MSPNELTLAEVSQALAEGKVSSVEVTRACLARIAAEQDRLGLFISLDEAGALAQAEASDARRKAGHALGPLDGVPVALKDNIVAKGLATTAASRILAGTTAPGGLGLAGVRARGKAAQGFAAPADSTVMRRQREAGAVLLGKTNLDEFGMGSSTENSGFGPTRNPWDPSRTPGGSSGGSAAAVAARVCFASLGTDTGGSIRQPAALSGVVGLKPTWGRVSRNGVVAFASSLDQVGPLTRTVRDAAMMLRVIAGADVMDSTSADKPVQDWTAGLEDGVKGLRVGLPREYFVPGMDPEVERAVREAAKTLERLGATVREVSLPHSKVALAAYYVIATSEASSNLGRYDGVRYGYRAETAKGLRELYAQSRAEGFGPEVKRRILLGTFALSAGYHDAYYGKAQKVRTLIRRDFDAAFADVDVLVSATSPVPAWPLGEKLDDPLSMYLMDVLTIPCNLAGLPGLSVPVAFTGSGLPIGVQVLGRAWDEATVLRTGRALEREADLQRVPGRA